jgi:hypothetical protein
MSQWQDDLTIKKQFLIAHPKCEINEKWSAYFCVPTTHFVIKTNFFLDFTGQFNNATLIKIWFILPVGCNVC